MAGNTRGKLKEHFEGVHRNFDWIEFHICKSLSLIQENHPKLSESLVALGEGVDALDKLAQEIYSKL